MHLYAMLILTHICLQAMPRSLLPAKAFYFKNILERNIVFLQAYIYTLLDWALE